MRRSPPGTAAGVAIVALVLGIAILALRGGSREVTVDGGPEVTPPESGSAVVATLRESGGLSLLGLRITDSTHLVEVRFTTDPGCSPLLAGGDPWPAPFPQCAGPPGVVGTVGGLGVTASGRSVVGVEITVTRACFQGLTRGGPWPSGLPECDA